jgi:hypothetical protein
MQVTSLLSQQDNAAAPEVTAQAAVQQKLTLTAFGLLLVVFNSARLVRLGEHLEPFARPVAASVPAACVPCSAVPVAA